MIFIAVLIVRRNQIIECSGTGMTRYNFAWTAESEDNLKNVELPPIIRTTKTSSSILT